MITFGYSLLNVHIIERRKDEDYDEEVEEDLRDEVSGNVKLYQ